MIPRDLVTTAFLALLRGADPDVHDHVFGGDPSNPVYPFHILYSIPGGGWSGPIIDDQSDATLVYQVTTVAKRRDSAELGADLLAARVLDMNGGGYVYPLVMPAGWACIDRSYDGPPEGIERVGDPPHHLFNAVRKYAIAVTPNP